MTERTVQYDEDVAYTPQPDFAEEGGACAAQTALVQPIERPTAARRSASLRHEVNAHNAQRAAHYEHETTFSSSPCTVYREQADGTHGNFFPASYRRIVANPEWAGRLDKAYTGAKRMPHARQPVGDRRRRELDSANSSDALLMNVFCHPAIPRAARLCALLGVPGPLAPRFGVRAHVPLNDGHNDRTEIDLVLGDLLVEAKLGESDFQTARPALLERYPAFPTLFDPERLVVVNGRVRSYQLLRCVMAAHHLGARFTVTLDARRADLVEDVFEVYRAVRSSDVRSRLHITTWQEIAACVPRTLQAFLAGKYGIAAAR